MALKFVIEKETNPILNWLEDDGKFFTDFTIISSDDHPINVHRVVLAHYSDFFKAAMKTDTIEAKTNVIILSEDERILNNLVNLIYKREFKGKVKDFMDLIIATKKYLMLDIHEKCISQFKLIVNMTNAVDLLVFACDNEIDELKKYLLEFIGMNFEKVRSSTKWNLLVQNPTLLEMAIDEYIKYVNNNMDSISTPSSIDSLEKFLSNDQATSKNKKLKRMISTKHRSDIT